MAFADLLIHLADIKRFTPGAVDNYGNPAKAWAIIYADEPCRFISTGGREIKIGAEVVISNWQVFVDDSVIVTEQDRVDNIRLASSGVVIDASTYEVKLVRIRSNGVGLHHSELALQKVA